MSYKLKYGIDTKKAFAYTFLVYDKENGIALFFFRFNYLQRY